jgi:hypothetical protein
MAEEPNSAPAAGTADDEKPINPKLLIPKNDGALVEVARLVNEAWAQESWFTLRWKTQAQFATLYNTFATSITDKRSAANSRTPQSQRLQELDDEMEEGLRFLKKYINEDSGYSKEKTDARLPGFGLERQSNRTFGLPIDRGERRDALLKFLLPAVAAAPFKARPYGTEFWQTRYDEYNTLLEQTDGLAGKVTKSVSKKDEAKKELRRVLQAVVYALRANFPDTYAAELRAWGFRKTSY